MKIKIEKTTTSKQTKRELNKTNVLQRYVIWARIKGVRFVT